MRIVVAGASGFLGRPLIAYLRSAGHQVTQLVRREPDQPSQLRWDPTRPVRLPAGTDAVVNIGGAGVGDHRWTKAYKDLIYRSRVVPTTTIANAVREQGIPLLVNASGVAGYGDRGDEVLTDDATTVTGDFLADLSVDWESAAMSAAPARVVVLRTGLPLHRSGGLLKPLLLAFRLGVGGKLGNGRQWLPWVSREDWLRAVGHILTTDEVAGPVNVAGPTPATNAEFTKTLGGLLHRPTIMPIPEFGVRLLIGEFADEAFKSTRLVPEALQRTGFEFHHRTIREALVAALHD
ncbi:MAG: TIGR01777 family protein [Hamadaea sp.]|uniref:TIGR01777 family oxidoreductase n=1 Tax=Hamadaea sp. TaxID=2024425 RepID=UPI0017DD2999|nr:TIGR01777 family oxidoreductase [Hamadaea sp.]NUT21019.1 TIGR01777 family protein [Hamadaea sp.]